ncbi:hypothetical protein LZ554_004136 [Drepanopeziza brunnea f. sp. 'monogermtubi']|nr:hypothetical protein LZ554_004136 [Drepanopeziza brunnea f. sp. 'monogermtubi']
MDSEMLVFGWPMAFGAVGIYLLGGAVYRLYLSPLSKFPGPKLAALTLWYEFYFDVVKTGRYMAQIKKMHDAYGPIVRISPYELHVNDPNFYEELYAAGGKKRDKYAWATRMFGQSEGSLGTVDHDLHRMRRAAISPFFSKSNVRKLEPIIHSNISKLMGRMYELEFTSQPIDLNVVYSAFTSDIIMEYGFGESQHYLEKDDFNADFFGMMDSMHHLGAAAKQFGWLLPVMLSIPEFITTRIDKGMAAFVKMQNTCRDQITAIMQDTASYREKAIPTVFHDILEADLPAAEKCIDRLMQEGQTFVAAGTETTAWCLTVITFYLLENRPILDRLRRELRTANASTSTELERLPYLAAIIQEGLRLSFGVCTRLQRIATVDTLILRDGDKVWQIPPNTPVGMSAGIQHLDPRIFPDPLTFLPERWLNNNNNKGLERYLVTFSKGSRQCVGINLAYSELFLCLNAVFGRYGGVAGVDSTAAAAAATLSLFETTNADVELDRDLFVPGPKKGSKGVRVVFSRQ